MRKLKHLFISKVTNIILCIGLMLGSIFQCSPIVSAKETYSYTTTLSEWNIWLWEHQDYINVYNTVRDAVFEDKEREEVYPDEFLIGLIANIICEGTPGIVEYSFSSQHQYGFYLPSGGCRIQTMSDIDYLLNWTTSNVGTKEGGVQKGSCGVSSVQWSFGRRITWLNLLKDHMKEEGRTEVTRYDLNYADTEMILAELDPDNEKYSYYSRIQRALANTSNPTAEDYAEALCDIYFSPAGCDLYYLGTGTACITRRAVAKDLWSIYTNPNTRPYEIVMTLNY